MTRKAEKSVSFPFQPGNTQFSCCKNANIRRGREVKTLVNSWHQRTQKLRAPILINPLSKAETSIHSGYLQEQYLLRQPPAAGRTYFRTRRRSGCSRHYPSWSWGNRGRSARPCPRSRTCSWGGAGTTAGTRGARAAGSRSRAGRCCRSRPRRPRSSCSRRHRSLPGTWTARSEPRLF